MKKFKYNAIKVYKYINKELVGIYSSINEAAEHNNFDPKTLKRTITGKNSSHLPMTKDHIYYSFTEEEWPEENSSISNKTLRDKNNQLHYENIDLRQELTKIKDRSFWKRVFNIS